MRLFIIGKNSELPRDCFQQLKQIPAPRALGEPAGWRLSTVTVEGVPSASSALNRRAHSNLLHNATPTGALIPYASARRRVPVQEPAAPWDLREIAHMAAWFSLVCLWAWW